MVTGACCIKTRYIRQSLEYDSSRISDNLWNMILLENKASISFVQFNFQYSSENNAVIQF